MYGADVGKLTAVGLVLCTVPFVWNSFIAYQLGLYLLYGMVAQGVALCWGKGGFLPLGQALFFGIGAYIGGSGLIAAQGNWALIGLSVLAAVAVPALIAFGTGALVFARRAGSGPFFSLITLALSLLGLELANSQSWLTGGFNGMVGIPALPGLDSFGNFFFIIVAALLVSTAALIWLARVPWGLALSATAQNEGRMQLLGFNTARIKAVAFGISAISAGLAGALFASHQGIVTPQSVGFLLSAELVIWTAVGGRSTVYGPVVAAILIGFLATNLRDVFPWWEAVIALLFILVVVHLPDGLASLIPRRLFGPQVPRFQNNGGAIVPPRDRAGDASIVLQNVDLTIGASRILTGLSFTAQGPGITCLIGPNGAGKSSAFNVMTGHLPRTAGNITLIGEDLGKPLPYQAARKGLARKLQTPCVFADLTIAQNLNIALWSGRISKSQMFSALPYGWQSPVLDRLLDQFTFLQDHDRRASDLSVGQRQMLDFTMTCLTDRPILLLDEPCAGLSGQETEQLIESIADMTKQMGLATIVIEHDMRVVEALADEVVVMHQGAVLATGTIADIRSNAQVQAIYGGGSK